MCRSKTVKNYIHAKIKAEICVFTQQNRRGLNRPTLRPLWLMTSAAADDISVPRVYLLANRLATQEWHFLFMAPDYVSWMWCNEGYMVMKYLCVFHTTIWLFISHSFYKTCLFSLSWKTTCLQRGKKSVDTLYRFQCICVHPYIYMYVDECT